MKARLLFLFLFGAALVALLLLLLLPAMSPSFPPGGGSVDDGRRRSEEEGFQPMTMSNTSNTALALIDCVVKASFQSAYNATTNTVTLAQLRTVIGRGVRWLDFDVLSLDAQPVVGFTTQPVRAAPLTAPSTTAAAAPTQSGDPPNAAGNSLPLTSVLNEVAGAAFNGATSPNAGDPLFVNLRIKTNDSAVYPTVAAALGNAFGSALHSSRLAPERVTLASLTGKVVFVLDTLHSAPAFASRCDNSYVACAAVKQVRSLAGLLCGTAAFPLTTATVQAGTSFSPVMPTDPGAAIADAAALSRPDAPPAVQRRSLAAMGRRRAMAAARKRMAPAPARGPAVAALGGGATASEVERDTSATRWRCTVPDFAAPVNGDIAALVSRWGIQVAPQCFWRDDAALAAYESLFQDNGGAAFLALSSAIGATTTTAAEQP